MEGNKKIKKVFMKGMSKVELINSNLKDFKTWLNMNGVFYFDTIEIRHTEEYGYAIFAAKNISVKQQNPKITQQQIH